MGNQGTIGTTKVGKFMSLVLRHKPEIIGLELDSGGWASISALAAKARAKGVALTESLIRKVVAESDKQRFSISDDGLLLRANHGHSVTVSLGLTSSAPPEYLYHGTARRLLSSIATGGILPGTRQFVHLSPDVATALKIGSRHGKPVVLTVHAARMQREGFLFYCSASGVWLTKQIPAHFLASVRVK